MVPPVPQVAAILTLPFDVVKTQRQIELGNMETLQGERQNVSRGRRPLSSSLPTVSPSLEHIDARRFSTGMSNA